MQSLVTIRRRAAAGDEKVRIFCLFFYLSVTLREVDVAHSSRREARFFKEV